MSIEDMRTIFSEYDGTRRPHLKATLVSLAFHANRDTGRCCPSFETIGWETGVSARTAIRNVEALIALGILEKEAGRRQGKGGRFAPNSYRIHYDRLAHTPYGAHDKPCDGHDATDWRTRHVPSDADVRGTLEPYEPRDSPPDLPLAGPVDEPSEEERARRKAVIEENHRILRLDCPDLTPEQRRLDREMRRNRGLLGADIEATDA